MKRMFCVCVFLFIFACSAFCSAEELAGEIPQQWNDTINNAPITADEFKGLTFNDVADYFIGLVKDTVKAPLRLFARLCAVIILSALARSFCGANATAALSDTVITIAVFTLCCAEMLTLLSQLSQTVEESRVYMSAFIPVFSSVMLTCGQTGGAAVYNGLFFASCMFFSSMLCDVGVPVMRIYLALNAVTCADGLIDGTGIIASVEKWLKWILTFTATAFAALLSMQTALAQSTDNIMLKASRFIVGSSVPVIGRAVSDAVSSVLSGLKLLKGTVGFAAIAVICALFLPLLVGFCIEHMVFTLAQVAASGVGMGKTAKLLDGFARCISICISMLFLFMLMVVSSTMVMILIGGAS